MLFIPFVLFLKVTTNTLWKFNCPTTNCPTRYEILWTLFFVVRRHWLLLKTQLYCYSAHFNKLCSPRFKVWQAFSCYIILGSITECGVNRPLKNRIKKFETFNFRSVILFPLTDLCKLTDEILEDRCRRWRSSGRLGNCG